MDMKLGIRQPQNIDLKCPILSVNVEKYTFKQNLREYTYSS
jgi:hypothetical protein